jgi:hypothetical protein
LKKILLAMRSFEPGEWRNFNRPDQTRWRSLLSLDSSPRRSTTSNPSLPFLLFLPDIYGGRGKGDFKEDNGAINGINGNGGDGRRGGLICKGNPFARVLATNASVFSRTSVEVWRCARVFILARLGRSTKEG